MIYFDNAATTYPKPDIVYSEVMRCMTQCGGNPGRSAHRLSVAAAEMIYACRTRAANLFHSDAPENVVFTCNATYALNIAIKSVVRRGWHVLISNIEHNSVYRPVAALAQCGVEYGVYNACADDEAILQSIRAKLRPNTKALITTHASNICGIRQPIEKIGALCQKHGILLIVDAAQSAGIYDVDMEKCRIDVLCAPGHKALYGIQGSGFALYSNRYREESAVKRLHTLIEGGNGVNSLERTMPAFMPERFEAGTLATPAIAGLCAGIQYISSIGLARIQAHEARLYRRMRDMLDALRPITLYAAEANEGSTLLFNVNGMPSNAVAAELDRYGICVRSGFHCAPLAHKALGTGEEGAVRVSFGLYNTMEEVELFYKRLKSILP